MHERFLLDTNALIAGRRRDLSLIMCLAFADSIAIPSIALGELFSGAYRSGFVASNVAFCEAVARNNLILACDAGTAKAYGTIEGDLRRRGRPLPDNDVWIAALALQHDLTLLTRDAHFAHFAHVPNLRTESW